MKSEKLSHKAIDIVSQPVPDGAVNPPLDTMFTFDQAARYLRNHGVTTYEATRWSRMSGNKLFDPHWPLETIRIPKKVLDQFLMSRIQKG